MRILVLGANGQVGTELVQRLPFRLGAEVTAATRSGQFDGSDCEICDLSAPNTLEALVRRVQPDAVVNAAAYTAVDRAESEKDIAFAVNGDAPGVLAKACSARQIPFVHYSTDYVFDGGGKLPYQANDPTNPAGVYGASKLAGENAVRASAGDALILRTAWVYGLQGQNFLRTMLRLVDREEIGVVDDQIGGPTPSWLIAEVTAVVLQSGFRGVGVHHVVGAGETSWAGFADALFDEAIAARQIASRPVVKRISTADYPTPAYRPAYSVLSTESLKREFSLKLPSWRECLKMTFRNDAAEQAQSIQ